MAKVIKSVKYSIDPREGAGLPINKDVKEVIKEISKAPFGRASKPDKSKPMLTLAETEEAKEAAKKVPPITVKKEAAKLTAKEKDKAIKQIAKERGISYNQAKETLRKELTVAPKATPVKQSTVTLPKGIPFRSEIEDVAPRAVSYKGKTIYLTPGQITAMGLKPDILPSTSLKGLTVGALPEDTYLTKGEQSFLTQEKMKVASDAATETRYRDFLGVESRAARDAQATLDADQLRAEAAKDWSNQARAAATNPQVRNPAEALGKATPDSAKAEFYAERLYSKAYKELSPKERKDIKIIIEEENRKAQKVTRSTVGAKMDEQKVVRPGVKRYKYKGSTPPIVPKIPVPKIVGPLGFIGMAAEMFFSYKLMAQQEQQRLQQETMN